MAYEREASGQANSEDDDMATRPITVVVEALDVQAQASFWAKALGWRAGRGQLRAPAKRPSALDTKTASDCCSYPRRNRKRARTGCTWTSPQAPTRTRRYAASSPSAPPGWTSGRAKCRGTYSPTPRATSSAYSPETTPAAGSRPSAWTPPIRRSKATSGRPRPGGSRGPRRLGRQATPCGPNRTRVGHGPPGSAQAGQEPTAYGRGPAPGRRPVRRSRAAAEGGRLTSRHRAGPNASTDAGRPRGKRVSRAHPT